jgi:polyphosphate kinase
MELPFDGAISRYYEEDAPAEVRAAIAHARRKDIKNPHYPYAKLRRKREYEAELQALQVQLVRLQAWVKESGQRVCLVFEGRDAAGKGGTIKRFHDNLNPRGARIVALPKPTDAEAGQWYFQRYVAQLPTRGEIVSFDRSWFNRGVVEDVFGFCTPTQRERWFEQVVPFEKMLVEEGIHLFKFWINVGQATQLERFLARERDPLKQWKLSFIDVEGLKKWDAYSTAIEETLERTHSAHAPWTVVRGDDKRRARVEAIRTVLHRLDYDRKDPQIVGSPDPLIAGGPEIWHG